MIKYVSAVMLNADLTQVCLILKETPAWQSGNYNIIGGKAEAGEEPIHSVIREVFEETGVTTLEEDWTYVTTAKSDDFTLSVYAMSDDSILNAKTMTVENIEIHNVDDLPKNLVQHTDRFILRAIKRIQER